MEFAAEVAATARAAAAAEANRGSNARPTCDSAPVNAARTALDTETAKYLNCLPDPSAKAAAASNTVTGQVSAYAMEVDQLNYMSRFLINHNRNDPNGTKFQELKVLIQDSINDLQEQQEVVRAEIRKGQRVFTDSNIQTSPAIGGLYFTKVPDNQILIAFMTCLGAFLLFGGLLIIFDMLPIYYFQAMIPSQRWTTVALIWAVALIFSYIFLFTFT
jgi:hypothetical protein